MKKLLIIVSLFCATAMLVQAEDATAPKKPKKETTAEQKRAMAGLLAKYDTNKDGKLDKTEKAAMNAEDKAAWAKAAGAHGKKKAGEHAPEAAKPEVGK